MKLINLFEDNEHLIVAVERVPVGTTWPRQESSFAEYTISDVVLLSKQQFMKLYHLSFDTKDKYQGNRFDIFYRMETPEGIDRTNFVSITPIGHNRKHPQFNTIPSPGEWYSNPSSIHRESLTWKQFVAKIKKDYPYDNEDAEDRVGDFSE